jgi:hypothetical protein
MKGLHMNVAVLQQFLHSLVPPLRAAGSSEPAIAQLENACRVLEPFRDRQLAEFGQFLTRCQDYEHQGHWPTLSPAIAGELLDEPTPVQCAERLRMFLQRETPGGQLSDRAREELKKWEKALKPVLLQQIAKELGVSSPTSKKPQLVSLIVQQLTGQSLAGKPASRGTSKVDDAALQSLAATLRQRVGTPELDAELGKLQSQPLASLKSLAKLLGAKPTPASKAAALTAIRKQLGTATAATGSTTNQVQRIGEIVRALKAKAEMPGAPDEEIEAELRSLEQQMDRETAIAVCASVGIVRPVKTQQEAFDAIRRKVFEVKRARESIAY